MQAQLLSIHTEARLLNFLVIISVKNCNLGEVVYSVYTCRLLKGICNKLQKIEIGHSDTYICDRNEMQTA